MQYSAPIAVPGWFELRDTPSKRFERVSCCTVPCGDYAVTAVVSNSNARRTSHLGKLPYGWAFLRHEDSTRLYIVAYHHVAPWRGLLQQVKQCEEGYDLMVRVDDNQSAEIVDTVDAVWLQEGGHRATQ